MIINYNMILVEEKGDLFELDNSWTLAHCVGNDFVMGKGIAKIFKQKFGNQDWLIKNSKGIGTALLLSNDKININVFYLVTKKWSKYSKPNYDDLKSSLVDMFEQATKNNITKIAMPQIGCGLDGLKWNVVKNIIQEIKPAGILICIRYLID